MEQYNDIEEKIHNSCVFERVKKKKKFEYISVISRNLKAGDASEDETNKKKKILEDENWQWKIFLNVKNVLIYF